MLGRQWQVKSAGIEAHGLNPLAVKVMAEKGIDISLTAIKSAQRSRTAAG
ncbi:arsenate reductase [Lacticaseibacillus rhamnosus MTCC 5462]|nr:arsenate reductase [Lacticaseibacillus rhamnosus MTCC 5462]